ncbi:MAG: response regulator transcription factor [Saprospiraceae bacterium]|nr:response regulator transcription factor [Saprospiraceae bacterium]
MELLNAIIVDDEKSSLQNLQLKIAEYCPDICVIGSSEKPEEAIELIRHHKPDVIFLDIEMPRMSGMRMLDELKDYAGEVIFTTAYAHYAVDAIRISAFDYLVKPVSIGELQNAVARLVRLKQSGTKERLDILRQSGSTSKNQEDKIAIPSSEGLEFIEIKGIVRIESSSNYSRIFLTNGKNMFVTKLLKDFEDLLLPYHFYRVHNSHLINMAHIQKYIRGDGGQVVMQNGDTVDVSRRKKEEFLRLMVNN